MEAEDDLFNYTAQASENSRSAANKAPTVHPVTKSDSDIASFAKHLRKALRIKREDGKKVTRQKMLARLEDLGDGWPQELQVLIDWSRALIQDRGLKPSSVATYLSRVLGPWISVFGTTPPEADWTGNDFHLAYQAMRDNRTTGSRT